MAHRNNIYSFDRRFCPNDPNILQVSVCKHYIVWLFHSFYTSELGDVDDGFCFQEGELYCDLDECCWSCRRSECSSQLQHGRVRSRLKIRQLRRPNTSPIILSHCTQVIYSETTP